MVYRYIIFALMGVALGCLGLSSCHTPAEKEAVSGNNEIEFQSIVLDTVSVLEKRSDSPVCNLSINVTIPSQSNIYDLENIQHIFLSAILGTDYSTMDTKEAFDKYAQSYIANYRRDAEIFKTNRPTQDFGEEFDDLYHEDGEHANLPDIFYSYYESISDTIIYDHFGILSFQVKQTNNKGGDLSHESVRNYVIDLESGQLIDEDDIFMAGYDVALRPIIQNGLMQLRGVKSIDDLEDLGYFGVDEIIPNNNLLLTADGIIFTFNKGEYSAYQLPASEVMIPYSHVRSILRDSFTAKKLMKQ